MDVFIIVLGLILVAGVCSILWIHIKSKAFHPQESLLEAKLGQANEKIGQLEKALEREQSDKNQLVGKGKEMTAQTMKLQAEYAALSKEKDSLSKKLVEFETEDKRNRKDIAQQIKEIGEAKNALEDEKKRVREEDQDRRRKIEEDRDRMWNEHEMNVIAQLTDLVKQPHLQFTTYTNTNLPEDFDGKLKPDFLLDFLGQYVIFDAKVSKAQSLQNYINDSVKGTADKVKKNSKIYPHIFLVVPTEAISELKKLIYVKDSYYFYIISREALAPVLAFLKRISSYELAESLDPQKRENIINMLSELTTHISTRNAYELLLTKHGAETLERVAKIDSETAQEVERKNFEKKTHQFSPSEIKRLAMSLTEQNLATQQLASPKAAVKKKDLETAASIMTQELL